MSRVIHFGQYTEGAIPDYNGLNFDALSGQPPEGGAGWTDETEPKNPEGSDAESGGPEGKPGPEDETKAKRIVENAFLKAKQIIESAKDHSDEQILEARGTIARESAEAKKKAYDEGYASGSEIGKKEGYEVGYREGMEAGKKQADTEARKGLSEISQMVESIEKGKTKILQDCENGVQELAKTMARAILRRELEIDDKTMRSIIISAMDGYRNQSWVRIYVSRKTASDLMKADNNIVEALKDISDSVKVVSSPGLGDSACILETPDQVIDAGIDSQLDKLGRGVSEAMRKKPEL